MIRSQSTINIYDSFLKDRVIFLNGTIDYNMATLIVAKLLLLENDDKNSDIKLYINSTGGELGGCMSIVDTIQTISPDVSTICIGRASSAAAIILMSGEKGKRFCYPNSTIMIHQPSSNYGYQNAINLEISSKQLSKFNKQCIKIISENTNQPKHIVRKDIERDKWMNAKKALKYGIVDHIIHKK